MSINKLICGASTTNQMIETVNACVDGSKALDGIKALEAIEGVTLNVTGFYAGSTVGGGQFIYDSALSKAAHNGGTVIAPESIAAWDGTSADIATLLDWSGAGVGCFARIGNYALASDEVSPEQFGSLEGFDSVKSVNAALKLKSRVNFGACEYLCSDTVRIWRGNELHGVATIDGIATVIKKMPNVSVPLIQTELAGGHGGGVATHYYKIKNVTFDGNRANQTVEADLVQLWGAFVGTIIDNVRISESLGCPLTLQGGCDIKIGTLWIISNTVTNGAAIQTNSNLSGGSLAGILYAEQLYVENTSNKINGDPRNVKEDRAPAIILNRFISANINELHVEGASIPVSIERNIGVNINKLSVAWSGTSADKTFIQYKDNQTKEFRCGMFVSGSGMGDYTVNDYYVNLASGVSSDNLIDQYNYNTSGAGGEYTSARDLSYSPSRRRVFSNSLALRPVGTAQRCEQRLIKNDGVDHFYVARDNSNMYIGYSSDNIAVNDYIRLFKSTGNSAKIEMLKPFVLHTKADAADVNVGSMYIRQAGPLGNIPTYQAKSGQNAAACAISSVIIGGGTVPTQDADYVGQWYLQTSTPKKLYFAGSAGAGAGDWMEII